MVISDHINLATRMLSMRIYAFVGEALIATCHRWTNRGLRDQYLSPACKMSPRLIYCCTHSEAGRIWDSDSHPNLSAPQ